MSQNSCQSLLEISKFFTIFLLICNETIKFLLQITIRFLLQIHFEIPGGAIFDCQLWQLITLQASDIERFLVPNSKVYFIYVWNPKPIGVGWLLGYFFLGPSIPKSYHKVVIVLVWGHQVYLDYDCLWYSFIYYDLL